MESESNALVHEKNTSSDFDMASFKALNTFALQTVFDSSACIIAR